MARKHQNIAQNWDDLQQQMHAQHQFLNLMIEQCRSEYLAGGGSIYCHSGCGGCCTLHVHCLHTEAISIAHTITTQQTQQVADYASALQQLAQSSDNLKTFLHHSRDRLGNCPFLDPHSKCSIYTVRPLACRALLSTKEPHYCCVDFAALSSAEKQAFMASLDHSAVNFPTHYLAAPQQWGSEAEQMQHTAMLKSFGVAISGNLPYLVFLEQEYKLSSIIEQGAPATLRFLSQRQLDVPFLVQVAIQETK